MTERDRAAKLEELERLVNDPETPLDADRVWTLLSELREPRRQRAAEGRRA